VIGTKLGYTFDAARRPLTVEDASPGYIRRAASQESPRRLGVDRIDLYQLHLGRLPLSRAGDLIGTLERGEQ
jgi:aryl-alcohol dehydrogenase-like predicted oxidoreductase